MTWGDDHPHDAILREIEAKGLDGWKNDSGYHLRSIAENMMYQLKQLGDSLYSRPLSGRRTKPTSGLRSSTPSPT